ncbi:MAG: hypothetical protein U5K31_05580 [Balneolaceae bacterium]|nr:hypothetical protein [Balneolaceae bacterium]
MRIVVTDACIFIDLLECNACEAFFHLSIEVVTSYQVWMELESEQRKVLSEWVDSDRLRIIKISEDFVGAAKERNLSTSLSIADLSVWHLAEKSNDILLTSDGVLRKMAKRHDIKTHGLLWIFDQIYEEELIKPKDLILKLQHIFDTNSHYRSNTKLYESFEWLKKKWNPQTQKR